VSADLLAALSLVLVLEGLFLFAAPGAWKRMVTQMLPQPERQLSAIGGFMVIVGLIALYLIRSP
jgi:uncharacterized protein YjeT (DUF2065 family)